MTRRFKLFLAAGLFVTAMASSTPSSAACSSYALQHCGGVLHNCETNWPGADCEAVYSSCLARFGC